MNTDMTPMIHAYADYQRHRGFSPATVSRRSSTLGQFAAFCAPARMENATHELVTEFLARWHSPRTRRAYLSDLAAFYRWACRRNLLPHDPTDLVDPIRTPRALPRPIHAELVPGVIAAAGVDPALQLMVALAALAGLRRAEIAALDAADVGPAALVVRGGKGGKDRTVPLHPLLRGMLAGRRGPLFDVGPDTVGRRIRDHLRACGVDATAHQLRHTFATELARITRGDLLTVGALLGHSSPSTTAGYAALTGDRGADAVEHLFEQAT